MSDIATELGQLAIQISNEFRRKKTGLERELLEVKLKLQQLEASLDAADASIDHLGEFQIKIGGEFQCPWCWITFGKRAPIIPQPSDNDDDAFMCRECGREYVFPN